MALDDIKFFEHDGFRLSYREVGVGEPILLIHGFASSSKVNWIAPSWFSTFLENGYRVIAIDNRGHGNSDKSYNQEDYTPEKMAFDAAALLDHLKIEKAHVMGYSMGARISAFMALKFENKISSLIFGGLGIGMITGAGHWEPIQKALLANSVDEIQNNERGLMFRNFADRTKSDRLALAACVITSKKELTEEKIAKIKLPTLVVVGEDDDISGSAVELADLMQNAESFTIPNRNHMLAVGDKDFKKVVLNFLKKHPIKH